MYRQLAAEAAEHRKKLRNPQLFLEHSFLGTSIRAPVPLPHIFRKERSRSRPGSAASSRPGSRWSSRPGSAVSSGASSPSHPEARGMVSAQSSISELSGAYWRYDSEGKRMVFGTTSPQPRSANSLASRSVDDRISIYNRRRGRSLSPVRRSGQVSGSKFSPQNVECSTFPVRRLHVHDFLAPRTDAHGALTSESGLSRLLRESPFIHVRLVQLAWEPDWPEADGKEGEGSVEEKRVPKALGGWMGVRRDCDLGLGLTESEAEDEDQLVEECCRYGGRWHTHVVGRSVVSLKQFKSSYVLKSEELVPVSLERSRLVRVEGMGGDWSWGREVEPAGIARAAMVIGLHRAKEDVNVAHLRPHLCVVNGVMVPDLAFRRDLAFWSSPLPSEWLQALPPGPSLQKTTQVLKSRVLAVEREENNGRRGGSRRSSRRHSLDIPPTRLRGFGEKEGDSRSSSAERPRRSSLKAVVVSATGRRLSSHLLSPEAVTAVLLEDAARAKTEAKERAEKMGRLGLGASLPLGSRERVKSPSRQQIVAHRRRSLTGSSPVSPLLPTPIEEWPESLWVLNVDVSCIFSPPSLVPTPYN